MASDKPTESPQDFIVQLLQAFELIRQRGAEFLASPDGQELRMRLAQLDEWVQKGAKELAALAAPAGRSLAELQAKLTPEELENIQRTLKYMQQPVISRRSDDADD